MLRWPPPAILLQRRARYDCKVVTELPTLRALLYTLLVGVVRAVKVTKGLQTVQLLQYHALQRVKPV